MALSEKKPFQSARLTYRALEPEDEAFVHELESDPAQFIYSQPGINRPQAKRHSKRHFDDITTNCLLAVAICLTDAIEGHEAGEAIGTIILTGLPMDFVQHRYTEMGLGLLPDHQGKGYGSEAINWALEWAFVSAGMHRVTIKAFEFNDGAQRLYERLGFKHEGTVREMWFHNRKWWGEYEYGMLESEWDAREAEKGASSTK